MQTLMNTRAIAETRCKFCNKTFVTSTNLNKHSCKKKKRWDIRNNPESRLGFQLWHEFQQTISKKKKTFVDFVHSPYYQAYIKFGQYCIDVKCIDTAEYQKWLLDNKISIDKWCNDSVYTRFIINFLKNESPLKAVSRSIETLMELAKEAGLELHDYFRFGNSNRIVHLITSGRISPWMIYQCSSGIAAIEKLSSDQQRLIIDYINPESWAIRFYRYSNETQEIKELLKNAGF